MNRFTGIWAVVGAMAGSVAAVGVGCEPKIDAAQYDKVAVGMTLDEVCELLGPGSKQMGRELPPPKPAAKPVEGGAETPVPSTPEAVLEAAKQRLAQPTRETWAWRDPEGRAVLITFVDGRVASKVGKKLALAK